MFRRQRTTTIAHADTDPDAVVDAIVHFVHAVCAGRNEAPPAPFDKAADANAAERAMLTALYDVAKRNPAHVATDALAPAFNAIAGSDPPTRVARIAEAILAFTPQRSTDNLKETVQALMEVLATTFALDSPGAAAAIMSDVIDAIDADIVAREYDAATAVAHDVAAHALFVFDRDAKLHDSDLANAAINAAFTVFYAFEQHEMRTANDHVKAVVALTVYALVKGHAAECTETRQVFARNRLGIKDSVISRDQRATRVRTERFAGDRYLRHEEPPRPQLDRGVRSPQIDSSSIMTSL